MMKSEFEVEGVARLGRRIQKQRIYHAEKRRLHNPTETSPDLNKNIFETNKL